MNVLLVDPSPIIRECVTFLLRARKDRVHAAASLEETRAYLDTHPVDLLIIEPGIEGGSGLDLVRSIRADEKLGDTPLLVLTDLDDKGVILELVELGVSQCLLKRNFSVQAFLKRTTAAARSRPRPLTPPAGATHASAPAAEIAPADAGASLPTTEQVLERLKALKPIVSRNELLDRLREVGELRALSPAVANVLRLASREETSVDALVKAVRIDHAIALKVIKLANSSAFTRGDPVTSVKDAVVRIGTESIRQAVTNIGIIEQFSESTALPGLSSARFWEHGIAVAIAAAELARRSGAIAPEQAFTIGLLHDVGRILLAEAIPEQYAQVAARARDLALPLEQLEKRMLLMTHAEVAQEAMRAWSMPREIIDPIVYHHLSMSNIRSASPKHADAVAVVALANRLVHALEIGASGNDAVYPTEEFFDALRLPPDTIDALVELIPDMAEDLRIAMLSGAGPGPAPPPFAASLPPLLYVSASRADAMRIVLTPEPRSPGDPPRLAVVRVRTPDERAPLARQLLDQEQQAGAGGLPLLILSPSGALLIQENHLQGRAHRALAMPTTRGRIRAAIDSLLHDAAGALTPGPAAGARAA